jgi:XTP/dITP diphosphohydrolase
MSGEPETVVLATGNPGKLREFQALLGADWRLKPQSEFGIVGVEETGSSFTENALLKARHAAAETGLAAIADDSGLEVDALEGAPGIYSARYAGEDADDRKNTEKLLADLQGIPDHERTARFRCVVVFVRDARDAAPVISESAWEGQIAFRPSGNNGFGYDPVFLVGGKDVTSAELDADEKNRLSHRGSAVRRLREMLDSGPGAGASD